MTRVVADVTLRLGDAPDAQTRVEVDAPSDYRLDLTSDATHTSGSARVAVEADGPIKTLLRFIRG